MRTKEVSLVSFDGTERESATLARPERRQDLLDLVARGGTFIPRGAGLSYAAASMAEGTVSVDMSRLDRLLAFDAETGEVTVEPGVTVGALTDFLARRGRELPVVPGYPDITVGGCIAFDVHGKSQFHSGNFGRWVLELGLFHPSHGEQSCGPHAKPDLFALTLGGMGLTGIITWARLRTAPLQGHAVEVEAVAVDDLTAAAELMRARAASVSCTYSWNNLNRRRARFGRGVVYLEKHVEGSAEGGPKRRRFEIRQRFPLAIWGRPTAAMILSIYERLARRQSRRRLALRPALFPIEGLEGYYAAFGSRGFREYQIIVPFEAWGRFTESLEDLLAKNPAPITLGSLKLFDGLGRNLTFCGSGICLAIDVPATATAARLFIEIDRLAIDLGACVNLSKDSRISAELCRRIFPQYEAFRTALRTYDPEARCMSRLRTRVGV